MGLLSWEMLASIDSQWVLFKYKLVVWVPISLQSSVEYWIAFIGLDVVLVVHLTYICFSFFISLRKQYQTRFTVTPNSPVTAFGSNYFGLYNTAKFPSIHTENLVYSTPVVKYFNNLIKAEINVKRKKYSDTSDCQINKRYNNYKKSTFLQKKNHREVSVE